MQKPSIPEGTRDFGPEQVRKRTYIFDTIRSVFVKFGFQPLETPAMENLSTLTGKYGEEGDKLLFKIRSNKNLLEGLSEELLAKIKEESGVNYTFIPKSSKRGLRYDLTVPFARYVVMNHGRLIFPFKRYQIQPVWRGDKPQRGRYREFYQCDADVIGSDSLIYEAELIQIYDEVFKKLDIPVIIKVNNRKILQGIAEYCGCPDKVAEMTIALDKIEKIGEDKVKIELSDKGFSLENINSIFDLLHPINPVTYGNWFDDFDQLLHALRFRFLDSKNLIVEGFKGIEECSRVIKLLKESNPHNKIHLDITLARGLSYYTGCIFEVAARDFKMGSIGGGGRYADLTGVFGVPGLSGVGISFGADRIYDVMEGMALFPENLAESVQVMIASLDEASFEYAFGCATALRKAGISAELYPEPGKLKKQFEYAAKRNIPFVAIAGETEMQNGTLMLKDQKTGEQAALPVAAIVAKLGG
jgi:histidyl-tRNA synthetase